MESPRKRFAFRGLDGAQGRNRTTDTAIFSRLLYQLSYLGISPEQRRGRVILINYRARKAYSSSSRRLSVVEESGVSIL